MRQCYTDRSVTWQVLLPGALTLLFLIFFSVPALATEKFVYLSDGIYIADADGQNPIQVTDDTSHFYPALSPDLSTIAFGKSDFDLTNDLYLVDANGQNLRLLFDDTEGQSGDAVFSPDTGQIVFERSVPSFNFSDLYRIDLDGQNITQLTSDAYGETDPAFSADGNLIVYSDSNATGLNQLIKMNPDGSGKQEVTPAHEDEYYDVEPAFSPDGEKIVFNRSLDGAQGDIWKIGSDGTGLTRLTSFYEEGVSYASEPTWSPDGETILFYVDQPEPELCCTIWAMDADGSNQRRIVDLGFMPNFRQANAMEVGGELFEDLDVDFELTPDGDYEATVSASDSVNGIARYELAIDSHDDQGYVLRDSVDIDCSEGCPPVGPTETLILDGTEVQNDESDLRVQAIDGAGNPASAQRKVRKGFYIGITEPRVGRTDDPQYPVFGDERFHVLQPRYFRLMVPWERLEPSKDNYNWDAPWNGAPIDQQIANMRTINPDIKIVAVFWRTPCWAIIPQARFWDTQSGKYKDPCRREGELFPDNNWASWPDPYEGMINEYGEFVRDFVDRYSGPDVSPDQRIKLYMPWNEPNLFQQTQPQKCKQPHLEPLEHPDFEDIRCPGGITKQYKMTSDRYYHMLYKKLYDTIKSRDYDKSIKVLGGETADIKRRSSDSLDADEAKFTKRVVKMLKRGRRCGKQSGVKRLGAWSKHAYKDLLRGKYQNVQRVRRILDGLKTNGNPDPNFDTEGCTKNKQIWVTEVAGIYKDPQESNDEHCKLHDFLNGKDIAEEEPPGTGKYPDLRRTDIYMQYLYQTDLNFESGLLGEEDENPPDGELDTRLTYGVFRDWSNYAQGGPRPTRSQYEGGEYDCEGYWG